MEVKDGGIALKSLDLEYSGEDFNNGHHEGSRTDGNHMKLNYENYKKNIYISEFLPQRSSELTGYWKFEDSLQDLSSFSRLPVGEDGTSFSTSALNGSKSLDFGGAASDEVSYNFSELTDKGTFNFWIYQNFGSINDYIFDTNDNGNRFLLHQKSISGAWELFVNGVRIDDNLPIAITQGQWNFVSFSYDHSLSTENVKIYENGRLLKSYSLPLGSFVSPSTLYLGRRFSPFGADYWNGMMDEISIFRSVLTENEISLLYKTYVQKFSSDNSLSPSWTPKWDNIVGYWKMDGNWQDSSGNGNHGVVSGGDPIINSNKKIGSGSTLFSLSQSSTIDLKPIAIDKEYTISTWINVTDLGISITARNIFSQRLAGGPNEDRTFQLRVLTDTHSRQREILFSLETPLDGTHSLYSGTDNQIRLNNWVHVIARLKTNSNSVMSIFLDGKLVAEKSLPALQGFNPSPPIAFIGGKTGGNAAFVGNLDDLAIWDISLSDSEIASIYHRQKQKYSSQFKSEIVDVGRATEQWLGFKWSAGLPFGKELVGDFDDDGPPDSDESSQYFDLNEDLSRGLVGYWNFEVSSLNGTPNELTDFSGNSNHGTATNESRLVPGKLSKSGEFNDLDTGNDYVTLPNSSTLENLQESDYSISLWYKPYSDTTYGADSEYTSYQGLFMKSGWHTGITFYRKKFSATTFLNGGIWAGLVGTSEVTLGECHHVVAVFDISNGIINLYVDGKFDSSATFAASTPIHEYGTAPWYIGTSNPGIDLYDGPANGAIDEVGVWNRTLSENDVLLLYRRGANRLKLQVKSCVDSSCNCKSFSTNPEGSINDCDGDGITNSDDPDDIHQAEFIGPGGDGSTFFSELMNRKPENIDFDCDANTSDSNPDICVDDEILLTGGPKPTSPFFTFDDYLEAAQPQPNRYFQYRVHMEADENTACNGDPCLPELTSVNLNPAGVAKYYGQPQVVTLKKPIPYKKIRSAKLVADPCATFQLSHDGQQFLTWNDATNKWAPSSSSTSGVSSSVLTDNITAFSTQFGPGNLYLQAYLTSDNNSPCSIESFRIQTSEFLSD